MNGGLFGRGPGEGTVKLQLPDAHSDFVFAVAGEEFGMIACLLINLWTGVRPNKRTLEMLAFYFMGIASEDEVKQHIVRSKMNRI